MIKERIGGIVTMISKFAFLRQFFPKKKLKDRVKRLEEQVIKLEKASFVPIEIGGDRSFFHTHEFVGVNYILRELVKDLGYDLIYRQEIKERKCLKKKSSKK